MTTDALQLFGFQEDTEKGAQEASDEDLAFRTGGRSQIWRVEEPKVSEREEAGRQKLGWVCCCAR